MMLDLPPIGGGFTPHGTAYEDGGSMLSVSYNNTASRTIPRTLR